METAVIVAVVGVVVAAFSAGAAFWSAGEARRANRKAEASNEIARKALSEAEEANRIAAQANDISDEAVKLQKLHAPPAWSAVATTNGAGRKVKNTSGPDIVITSVDAMPSDASGLLHAPDLPIQVGYGDWFRFGAAKLMGPNIEAVDIRWHYTDSPDTPRRTSRRLP